jgi:hypothetical protein
VSLLNEKPPASSISKGAPLSLTYQYLLVRGAAQGLEAAENTPRHVQHQVDGWTAFIVDTEDLVGLEQLEHAAAMTSRAHGITMANYVETSDYGYCVGARNGNIDYRVMVNPDGAEGLVEGMWALERCRADLGPGGWSPQVMERVQAWADSFGVAVSLDDLVEVLNRHWVYPEDGVKRFLQVVGVPDIDWHWIR